MSASLFLASLLVLTWITGRSVAVAGPAEGRVSGAWALFLLALAGALAVVYLVLGARVVEITQNDGAYYFGVARHMAITHRFEEPVLWHFIRPPDRVLHVPFDYWGCMTSLLLVPGMMIFGPTPETAFRTISAISAASLIAFWYLVCFALPLRHWAAQLVALLAFALSQAMVEYRFQTESIAVAQAFILLALIAFCHRRFVLTILAGFCILLTRGDGLVMFGLILAAVLLQEWKGNDGGWLHLRTPLVGVACLGIYVFWNLVSFGTLWPPAVQTLPFLSSYWEIFDFGVSRERSWSDVWRRFDWAYVTFRLRLGLEVLRRTPFTPQERWWLVIAALPALRLFRHRPAGEPLIWLLCFGGYFTVVWSAGPGFYLGRTPHTFTPLIVLAGALGIDAILAAVGPWSERGRPRALVVSAGAFALCCFLLTPLPSIQVIPGAALPAVRTSIGRLDEVLGGEPVASNVPWYVSAYTRSPTVSVPFNGEAAMASVLERYHTPWLVIFGDPAWVQGASRPVLQRVLAGSQTNLGRFQLERVRVPVPQAVFRVRPAP